MLKVGLFRWAVHWIRRKKYSMPFALPTFWPFQWMLLLYHYNIRVSKKSKVKIKYQNLPCALFLIWNYRCWLRLWSRTTFCLPIMLIFHHDLINSFLRTPFSPTTSLHNSKLLPVALYLLNLYKMEKPLTICYDVVGLIN